MAERSRKDWFWIGLLALLQLLPIVAVFLNSIAVDWAGTILPDGYTLNHIDKITHDPRFTRAILNSLIVGFGSLIVTPIIVVPAILVAHCYFPALDRTIAGLVILPYAVPTIVLALGLLRLYSGNYGIVLTGSPWVLIFGYMPLVAPLYYIPIKNNLRALRVTELFEAGRLLGASDALILLARGAALHPAGPHHRARHELHACDQRFRLCQSPGRRPFPHAPDPHGGAPGRQRTAIKRAHLHLFHRHLRGDGHRRLGDITESRRMSYVEIRKLTKRFDGTMVFEDIDLDVEQGRICVLVGPSGCGKTTLLRAVAGLTRPDSGHIMIDGRDVTHVEAKHRGVGMVFQHYALFPNMTVEQNLAFGLEQKKLARPEIAKKVAAVIELMGLGPRAKAKPAALSGGQKQRVALARALVLEPKLLLLDEPLSALDAQIRKRLRDELKRLQQDVGFTAIFVTHDQEEAMMLGDQVAIMQQGRFAQIGAPAEIYNRPASLAVANFIGDFNILEPKAVERLFALAPPMPGRSGPRPSTSPRRRHRPANTPTAMPLKSRSPRCRCWAPWCGSIPRPRTSRSRPTW